MFPIFAYLSQEILVAMWDGISVPFIEHHACGEMNFGKNDPKRCQFTPRIKGSHVGWHFCPWFDTAHAQKQKTRF